MALVATEFLKPPYTFKGSALYQVHIVKAETVRPFIPRELKIQQTLGYTVGGFFLANYEDSPFGAFDELVVIAGTVRNGRSVYAWAGKVLVNNGEARDHGRKEFGLPSQVANFSQKMKAKAHGRSKQGSFLNIDGLLANYSNYNYNDVVEIAEIIVDDYEGPTTNHSCNFCIKTPADGAKLNLNRFIISPRIKISLPSLSGLTEYNPHLLEYNCQIETRVRPVATAKVSEKFNITCEKCESSEDMKIRAVLMQSRPLIAFEFNSMRMVVDSPTLISQR